MSDDVKTTITAKNGIVVVASWQDVEPYLKANVAEYNEAPSWRPYSGKRGLRKVASVPENECARWLIEEGINAWSSDPDMMKRVRKKLDDYTNRKFRTYPGRLGSRARMF